MNRLITLDDERFSAYLDGELSSAERAEFERLLASSDDAQRQLAELRQVSTWVSSATPKADDRVINLTDPVLAAARSMAVSAAPASGDGAPSRHGTNGSRVGAATTVEAGRDPRRTFVREWRVVAAALSTTAAAMFLVLQGGVGIWSVEKDAARGVARTSGAEDAVHFGIALRRADELVALNEVEQIASARGRWMVPQEAGGRGTIDETTTVADVDSVEFMQFQERRRQQVAAQQRFTADNTDSLSVQAWDERDGVAPLDVAQVRLGDVIQYLSPNEGVVAPIEMRVLDVAKTVGELQVLLVRQGVADVSQVDAERGAFITGVLSDQPAPSGKSTTVDGVARTEARQSNSVGSKFGAPPVRADVAAGSEARWAAAEARSKQAGTDGESAGASSASRLAGVDNGVYAVYVEAPPERIAEALRQLGEQQLVVNLNLQAPLNVAPDALPAVRSVEPDEVALRESMARSEELAVDHERNSSAAAADQRTRWLREAVQEQIVAQNSAIWAGDFYYAVSPNVEGEQPGGAPATVVDGNEIDVKSMKDQWESNQYFRGGRRAPINRNNVPRQLSASNNDDAPAATPPVRGAPSGPVSAAAPEKPIEPSPSAVLSNSRPAAPSATAAKSLVITQPQRKESVESATAPDSAATQDLAQNDAAGTSVFGDLEPFYFTNTFVVRENRQPLADGRGLNRNDAAAPIAPMRQPPLAKSVDSDGSALGLNLELRAGEPSLNSGGSAPGPAPGYAYQAGRRLRSSVAGRVNEAQSPAAAPIVPNAPPDRANTANSSSAAGAAHVANSSEREPRRWYDSRTSQYGQSLGGLAGGDGGSANSSSAPSNTVDAQNGRWDQNANADRDATQRPAVRVVFLVQAAGSTTSLDDALPADATSPMNRPTDR